MIRILYRPAQLYKRSYRCPKTFRPTTYNGSCPMRSSGKITRPGLNCSTMLQAIGVASAMSALLMAFLAVRERNLYANWQDTESAKGTLRLHVKAKCETKKQIDIKETEDAKIEFKPILNIGSLAENFTSGNRMHFIHSMGVMATSFLPGSTRILPATLFVSGMALYSGMQYYRTWRRKPESLTAALWAGSSLLLAGWLTMLF